MLGDIVLFTYDELISVITMMSEEYKNNITCNVISCSAYKYNHHPKATFHRTRNRCKREYVLLEVALHDIAIRKIRFGLPKSGNTKVVPRKTVYRHDHVDPNNGLDAV